MSKTETAVIRAFTAAREEALAAVAKEAKRVLPKGWTIHLAVGWGMTVFNDKRETIMSDTTSLPARLPRGVRDLLKGAAEVFDLFGPANDIITSKGVSYPKPRRAIP